MMAPDSFGNLGSRALLANFGFFLEKLIVEFVSEVGMSVHFDKYVRSEWAGVAA
jgi:hypothetical protein